jgi:DNA polymerase-3 subunit gamma/tau
MDRALAEFKAQHDEGADPALIVTDLAEAVHLVTRLKLTPAALADPALGEDDRRRGAAFAKALPMRVLTRAWQMLLKGLAEVQQAPRPAVAAEMLIIRLAFAADLPTPDEAIRMLRDGASPGGGGPVQYAPAPGSGTAAAAPETKSAVAFAPPTADGPRMRISAGRPALAIASGEASIEPRERPPAPAARPAVTIESFAAFHALCLEKRDVATSVILENHVRPIRFAPGRFEFAVTADAPGEAANQVKRALDAHTGIRWAVSVAPDGGEPTIAEARGLRKEEERRGVLANPVVRAILERFPGAAVVAVRPIGPSAEEAAPPADAGEDDADLVGYDDAISDESFTEDDL